jgi:hypothetical protein
MSTCREYAACVAPPWNADQEKGGKSYLNTCRRSHGNLKVPALGSKVQLSRPRRKLIGAFMPTCFVLESHAQCRIRNVRPSGYLLWMQSLGQPSDALCVFVHCPWSWHEASPNRFLEKSIWALVPVLRGPVPQASVRQDQGRPCQVARSHVSRFPSDWPAQTGDSAGPFSRGRNSCHCRENT